MIRRECGDTGRHTSPSERSPRRLELHRRRRKLGAFVDQCRENQLAPWSLRERLCHRERPWIRAGSVGATRIDRSGAGVSQTTGASAGSGSSKSFGSCCRIARLLEERGALLEAELVHELASSGAKGVERRPVVPTVYSASISCARSRSRKGCAAMRGSSSPTRSRVVPGRGRLRDDARRRRAAAPRRSRPSRAKGEDANSASGDLPQAEGFSQKLCGTRGVGVGDRLIAFCHETLESVEIEILGSEFDDIAGWTRISARRSPPRRTPCAVAKLELNRLCSTCGRLIPPDSSISWSTDTTWLAFSRSEGERPVSRRRRSGASLRIRSRAARECGCRALGASATRGAVSEACTGKGLASMPSTLTW